jgi:porphobilinogen synthase
MEKRFMTINLNNLIYPYFVCGGYGKKEEIESFPKVFRFSVDELLKDIVEIRKLGLNKILLFGIPDDKDASASNAFKPNNIVALAVKELKREFPNLRVITDACLCSYTTHGHCGILSSTRVPVKIDNKKTLDVLAKIAVSHARAGADFVAPSAMAKGQVKAIRKALDKNGYKKTKIMGYSAKFASSFYGPFRNAADSGAKFGDRSGYQLGFGGSKKALAEIEADIKEGADIVMVKPALSYLDVIARAHLKFNKPLAAYNVSGEYAMVKAYVQAAGSRAERIKLEKNLVLEILTGIKRAGADLIITYHAKDVAKWLKE